MVFAESARARMAHPARGHWGQGPKACGRQDHRRADPPSAGGPGGSRGTPPAARRPAIPRAGPRNRPGQLLDLPQGRPGRCPCLQRNAGKQPALVQKSPPHENPPAILDHSDPSRISQCQGFYTVCLICVCACPDAKLDPPLLGPLEENYTGTRTVARRPPALLSERLISPPCERAMSRAIASPSPVPPSS